MHFDELTEGDYRIFAGAIEADSDQGYIAAVVVTRRNERREAYRDVCMSGGHRWRSADEALSFALRTAQHVIRTKPAMLAC